MFGSITGNIVGTLYFLAFHVCGIIIALRLLRNEKLSFKLLMGSVLGSVGVHWCPVLFSFMFDFTVTSHISGLVFFTFITVLVLMLTTPMKAKATGASGINSRQNSGKKGAQRNKTMQQNKGKDSTLRKSGNNASANSSAGKNTNNGSTQNEGIRFSLSSIKDYPFLLIGIPLFIFFCIMLWNHTIVEYDDGAIYTGQCTYGDMNMHLGFITSITDQQTFPPYYSILPDAKLAYPFLSDAISSSVYIWGATLRYAYMLPMWVAILQVMLGMYAFASEWLKNKWKAFLAFVLFFFNGGFGIIYFFNGSYTFDDLMNGFYNTPTNLVDVNVRWTNTIVDMLLPQRATLFGWALLFPVMCLIHKAWTKNKKKYYIIAAVIAGAIPMVHTHSFLALGIICFGWLLADMARRSGVLVWSDEIERSDNEKIMRIVLACIVAAGLILFSVLSYMNLGDEKGGMLYIGLCVGFLAILFMFLVFFFYKSSKDTRMLILKGWGVFLVIVLVLALPQLMFWTFKQVSGGTMLHGHFNWSNEGEVADPYILFYLKNIGMTGILFIPAWILGKKKDIARVMPALIIWFISELVVFQPNNYDNNKLLLVAYMLICCFVADAIITWLGILAKTVAAKTGQVIVSRVVNGVIVTILAVVFCISGVLTMAREYYSGTEGQSYQLYSKDLLDACRFIEGNTDPHSVFLTANNHNNAVSSLTGRNIVCGTSSFLFYHGLDYYERESNLSVMYSSPKEYEQLFKKYSVDYILVSDTEYGTYQDLNESEIYSMFPCIYSQGNVRIYSVKG